MLKKLLVVAALAGVSGATFAAEGTTPLAQAGFSFSGSAAITTDYRYRGITQTNNDPAVQVGFDLAHESGVYGGVWGSNIGFAESLELDPYLGFSTALPFGSKPTLDIGVWYYGYPSASDSNWAEYYASLAFDGIAFEGDSFSVAVNYANDFLGDDAKGDQWYFNGTYTFPISNTNFGGVASLGYTTTSDYYFDDDKNYFDWKVGVTYDVQSIDGFSAELAAVGTNIDTDGLSNAGKRAIETGAVFTLTKAF